MYVIKIKYDEVCISAELDRLKGQKHEGEASFLIVPVY